MFTVHDNLGISIESGKPWVSRLGTPAFVGGDDIPHHIVCDVIAHRQLALDRAAQMTAWLAAVQVKEKR